VGKGVSKNTGKEKKVQKRGGRLKELGEKATITILISSEREGWKNTRKGAIKNKVWCR